MRQNHEIKKTLEYKPKLQFVSGTINVFFMIFDCDHCFKHNSVKYRVMAMNDTMMKSLGLSKYYAIKVRNTGELSSGCLQNHSTHFSEI
jgi:hypothetical protein